jgi:hypothetical protein
MSKTKANNDEGIFHWYCITYPFTEIVETNRDRSFKYYNITTLIIKDFVLIFSKFIKKDF